MNIPERIKLTRRKAGLSQEALARRCGVARSAVSNWESATGANPATFNLIRIAEATGAAFEWLATGRGSMQQGDPRDSVPTAHAELIEDLHERRLLQAWRALSARMQTALLEIAEEASRLRVGKRRPPPPGIAATHPRARSIRK